MGLPAVAAKPRTSREDGTPVVAGGTAPRLRRRLRRVSLHSLREPRLVGGSGIEPLTPSMSRKFLNFEPICSALHGVVIIPIIQSLCVCWPLSNFATICVSLLAMCLLDALASKG